MESTLIKERNSHKDAKIAKILRVVTIPILMSLVQLSLVFCFIPSSFSFLISYLLSIVFLSILPILAYPLQK